MKLLEFRIYALAFIFCGIISFPLINSNANTLKDIESFENRAMATKPICDINHLDGYPVKYETFYNDYFNLRNILIRYFNIYKVRAFRKSPTSAVVIGAHDRLFLSGPEMDSFTGKNRLTQPELLSYKKELQYHKIKFNTFVFKVFFSVFQFFFIG